MTFDDLVKAVQARAWYPLVAILLWYVIALWKKYAAPLWGARIPDGWRWLPLVVLTFAGGFVDGYASKLPLSGALLRGVFAILALGLPAMGCQGAAKESPLFGGVGKVVVALALCCVGLVSVPACSSVKPIIRTTTDVAVEICETSVTAKSEAQKAGVNVTAWCNVLENLQPFIDAFLSARAQADKATLNRLHAPDGQDAPADAGAP